MTPRRCMVFVGQAADVGPFGAVGGDPLRVDAGRPQVGNGFFQVGRPCASEHDLAPGLAQRMGHCRPRPREPPVTSAVLPLRSKSCWMVRWVMVAVSGWVPDCRPSALDAPNAGQVWRRTAWQAHSSVGAHCGDAGVHLATVAPRDPGAMGLGRERC